MLTCVTSAAAPSRAAAAGPVPIIVDTDIFTDADDVGALGSAFALQRDGEAKVIAVTVNTPTYRAAVAPDQVRCVAAIDSFYGSPTVPIGTETSAGGTDAGSSYVGACAQLDPGSLPATADAVSVDSQALAAQPDGSVVMVSIGYLGNLAALISSSAGRQLVQRKVRELVVMGGGYPGPASENNLMGDPAAAQTVATNWPTKILWTGYEVGSRIFTGWTISATHPSNSPLRVAYEHFADPGQAIRSWDLAAVYDAVRPATASLTEVGPGVNAIATTGSNVFGGGAGSQYYLALADQAGLQCSIEALLDTLPGPPATAQIGGTVVDASIGNRAIAGALVRAYDSAGNPVASAQTGANGAYALTGLPSGCYRIGFSVSRYIPQYFSGTPTLAGAAAVSVSAGSPVTGVNAALGRIPLSTTSLRGIPIGHPVRQPPSHRRGSVRPSAPRSSGAIRARLVRLLVGYSRGRPSQRS